MISLAKAVAGLQSPAQAKCFLAVLLTPREMREMEARWGALQAAFVKTPQRVVAEQVQVGIGIATRAARMMQSKEHRKTVEAVLSKTGNKKKK